MCSCVIARKIYIQVRSHSPSPPPPCTKFFLYTCEQKLNEECNVPQPCIIHVGQDSDGSTEGRASPTNTITPILGQDVESDGTVKPSKKHQKKKPKTVLKAMRRRRKRAGLGAHTSEESDLSEGEVREGGHSNGSSESGDGSEDLLAPESDSDYMMDSQEFEMDDQEGGEKPRIHEVKKQGHIVIRVTGDY